ncbi:MAG: DnaJ domain-containing protein [Actinomycetota bacterium]|nr:DnaJ domain-containing protein [Actinomycetota bacterium]
MRVVTRRRFGPLVAIQRREERNRSTLARADPGADDAEGGDGADDAEDGEPAEPLPSVEPAAEDTAGMAEDTAGTDWVEEGCAVLGAGSAGCGSLGTAGSGTATGGAGTVTAGTGGMGTVSATAWPASRPAPTRTVIAAATLIPEQLPAGRIGCGVCAVSKNPDMAAVKRDYYEVLGLARDADGDTIKRAFHSLARDWHPDVADAPDAEARFRELAEAYGVLSKREARLLYDRYGYRGRGNQGFDEALWEARPAVAARGENVHVGIELRSFEATEGTRRIVSYDAVVRCKACMGRGSVGLPDPECEYCGGTGRKRTVSSLEVANLLQIEPCPACVAEACSQCGGEGTVSAERRIRLLVPPGVQDGAQLRVGGDGNDAGAGSIPGDLLVRVNVLAPPRDPRFVRYAAFVLLIVAVATLVFYLTR